MKLEKISSVKMANQESGDFTSVDMKWEGETYLTNEQIGLFIEIINRDIDKIMNEVIERSTY